MVLELGIYIIGVVVTFFGQYLPNGGQIPLLLPWGLDPLVVQGVTGFKILAQYFPPFTIVLQAFIAYIGFRIILQILKAVPVFGRTVRQD